MSNDDAFTISAPTTEPVKTRWSKLVGKLKRFKGAIVAIAGVGAVLGGLTGYWTSYQTVKTVAAPTSNAAPATANALSILVLPFANQTGDPQKTYVADALTSSITSDLSRIRDAFVVPAPTAFAYKDKSLTVKQVAADAGVRFVLHGNVQSTGDKLRINAQLLDSQTGAQLWNETFNGDLANLFALQDLITTRIGNTIGQEMLIVAARESETRKSSPKVTDLILRARALTTKPQTLANWQQVEVLYRQVLALEPNNAGAMAGLARSLSRQVSNFGSALDGKVKEAKYVESRDLALKVRELDPSIPEIYSVIALYAIAHDDFAGFQRAVETWFALDPKDPSAVGYLGSVYLYRGEPRRAIELRIQSINLNPKHPADVTFQNLGWAYFMLGDYDSAIEAVLKSLEINPAMAGSYALLAMAYALKGDDIKARAAVANARRVDPHLKLDESDKPQPSFPAAYKESYENKFLPAWRKAGLPE
jgi:TolB-like protein